VTRFFALAAFLAAATLSAVPSVAAEPGSVAAPFEVPGVNGPLKLSAYRGKLVYLDFWASWCGPCRRSFPWMSRLQARYGAQGLQVLAVNLDAKHADAVDFLSAMPVNFAVGFDPEGKVAMSYGVQGMPSSVLIGPDGKVVAMHAGFNEADKAGLEKLISQNLARMTNKRDE
jgi:thiol-disulfide isomerase/thioredoxin